jgi:hypothetical protein
MSRAGPILRPTVRTVRTRPRRALPTGAARLTPASTQPAVFAANTSADESISWALPIHYLFGLERESGVVAVLTGRSAGSDALLAVLRRSLGRRLPRNHALTCFARAQVQLRALCKSSPNATASNQIAGHVATPMTTQVAAFDITNTRVKSRKNSKYIEEPKTMVEVSARRNSRLAGWVALSTALASRSIIRLTSSTEP